MAQEVFLRTAAGIISADKFNDNISPFKPTRHGATAVFIREEQYVSPQTTPALGSTVRWEVNKDGDYLDKVWLVVSIAALSKNAGASFARFCDWLGYALIREFRAIYGPIILQRIRKEDLFIWAQRFLSDEEYVHNQRMVAGGLDAASRIAVATKPQYLKVPLHLLWINNSPTQCLCLQGTFVMKNILILIATHRSRKQAFLRGTLSVIFHILVSSESFCPLYELFVCAAALGKVTSFATRDHVPFDVSFLVVFSVYPVQLEFLGFVATVMTGRHEQLFCSFICQKPRQSPHFDTHSISQ